MFWLFLAIFIVSIVGISILLIRHYLDILILNSETLRKSDAEIKKEQIFEERIRRFWLDRSRFFVKLGRKIVKLIKNKISQTAQKIFDIERSLEGKKPKINQPVLTKQKKVNELIEAAGHDLDGGSLNSAEGKLVDAIRLDPRATEAYKGLADVYMAKRSYGEAQETLEFLRRLKPKDTEIYLKLIKIAEEQGQHAKLLEYLAKVIELSPNNPKHLDLLIETSILLKNKRLAHQGLNRLRKVNPDNQKIEDFEHRIIKL